MASPGDKKGQPVVTKPLVSDKDSSSPKLCTQTESYITSKHGISDSQPVHTTSPDFSTQPQSSETLKQDYAGAFSGPPKQDDVTLSEGLDTDHELSGSFSAVDDNPQDKQELTEEMNFRETVRSVRSFMGWDHIPVFESDYSEPDKTNNPRKGNNPKHPSRISVAMPPDDWLCQKLQRHNGRRIPL